MVIVFNIIMSWPIQIRFIKLCILTCTTGKFGLVYIAIFSDNLDIIYIEPLNMKVKRTDPNIIQTKKTEERPSYTNRQNGKYYVIKLTFKNVSRIRLF